LAFVVLVVSLVSVVLKVHRGQKAELDRSDRLESKVLVVCREKQENGAPVARLVSVVHGAVEAHRECKVSRASVVTMASQGNQVDMASTENAVPVGTLVFLDLVALVVPKAPPVLGSLAHQVALDRGDYLACRGRQVGGEVLAKMAKKVAEASQERMVKTARMVKTVRLVQRDLLGSPGRKGQKVTAANQNCKCILPH